MNASPSQSRALSGFPHDDLRSRDVHRNILPWSYGGRALWLIGLLGVVASAQAALPAERSAIRSTSYQLPLTFEVNQGQTDDQVKFLARGQGYTIFLTPTEAVFALPRPDAQKPARTVMRMQLVGSAPAPRMQGVDELPGKVNYFRGDDSAQWRTNVRTYKRVKYTAVYPGVDLVYYGQPQQLEYDFIVAPGADPSRIKLAFIGVDDTTVDAKGDLVLKTAGEPLRFQRPIIYQMEGGRRHTVEGGYVHRSPHEIGFRVGAYDRTRPLVIDPVLTYSTYLGGSDEDMGLGIAVDATGAAYVTGTTSSTDFPTVNALQPLNKGTFDAFVAKFTPDGTALVYATYLGGSNSLDEGSDIAVDSAGAAYITGTVGLVCCSPDSDFPTVNALQPTNQGPDAFVAKLSADGSQLIYSTFLGGTGGEEGRGIALDLTGAAYVTGATTSPDFPTTADTFQPVCTAEANFFVANAFVAKLTPDGTALAYSTCLGGSADDQVSDIAVDSLGAAHVTGSTNSADFPILNPVTAVLGLGIDAFVAKLTPDGKRLIYSTYLGDTCEGNGIAVDISGAAYVTGSKATRFVAFVVKLPPEGGSLIYVKLLSGSSPDVLDSGHSIAVDIAGAAYVTGQTGSSLGFSNDFPTMNPVQPAFGGGFDDAFVAKLSPEGATLVYSTYLGGGDTDSGNAIAVDLAGAAYVTGFTFSGDFPTVNALQPLYGGRTDAFVAKISGDSLAGAPTNDSISGGESDGAGTQQNDSSGDGGSDGDSGGGAMDALLALLLAQLAFVHARRRRIRPDRRLTYS